MSEGKRDVNGTKKSGKVSFFSSIKFKIMALTSVAVIVAVAAMLAVIIPTVQKDMKETVRNYMQDVAESYGETLQLRLDSYGSSYLNVYKLLNEDFGEVNINGLSTSYAYVVNESGTMMFHPNEDKVGNPVENAAVKGLVAQISAGEHPEPGVIEYEYKGAYKYAAYYVDKDNYSILVVTADEDDAMAEINRVSRMAYILAVVILIVAIGLAFLLASMITNPIIKISNAIDKLASLDMTENPELEGLSKRKDENGVMAKGMSGLEKVLSEVIITLKAQADNVRLASETLETGTNETTITMEQVELAVSEISTGATSQADETQKATEDVILMGNLVEENGQELQNLVEVARGMRNASGEAQETLRILEDINRRAVDSIGVIAEQTKTTNTSAQKIREATSLITAIAEETNLLSLNASIEAARAGEQGRGFAVVAEEIGKLAAESGGTAGEIRDEMSQLLIHANDATEKTDEISNIGREVISVLGETVDIINGLIDNVSGTVDGVNTISGLTEECNANKDQIVDAMSSLSAISEENAASTEQTSASMQELSDTVNVLAGSAESLNGISKQLLDSLSFFR